MGVVPKHFLTYPYYPPALNVMLLIMMMMMMVVVTLIMPVKVILVGTRLSSINITDIDALVIVQSFIGLVLASKTVKVSNSCFAKPTNQSTSNSAPGVGLLVLSSATFLLVHCSIASSSSSSRVENGKK